MVSVMLYPCILCVVLLIFCRDAVLRMPLSGHSFKNALVGAQF